MRLGGLVDHLRDQRRHLLRSALQEPLFHVRRRKPLHREVRLLEVPLRGVDPDDVRMLDPLTHDELPVQKLHLLPVRFDIIQQRLNADDPLLLVVIGLPDHAGMTGMDHIQQPVRANVTGGASRHGTQSSREG